jgi:hypothetical protein
MRALILLLLFCPNLLAGGLAPEAQRHYQEADKLFHLGAFYQAAAEYKLAYRAEPNPSFLYNAAQALRLAHELADAIFFYKSYLSTSPHSPMRREIIERIAALENELHSERRGALEEPPLKIAPLPPPTTTPLPPPPPTTTPPRALPEVRRAAVVAPRKKRTWPWAVAGAAVAVGVALGVGLGVGLNDGAPQAATTFHF